MMPKRSLAARLALTAILLLAGVAPFQVSAQQNMADLKATDTHALRSGTVPPVAIASPTGYLLGPSDVVHVAVWKEPDLSQTAVVRPDGKISLPLVGEIALAGSSVPEAQTIVADRLRSLLTSPQVTITVVEIHSRQVYITGEIGRPGAYPLAASMNVLQLIASAGGLTEYAHRKAIYILRASVKQPIHFNYNNVVRGKSQEQNVQLSPGDTVVIP
ncbi:MAG: polysaccharide biosynthesis/export family protein [Acidobacteriaceae bacterium]